MATNDPSSSSSFSPANNMFGMVWFGAVLYVVVLVWRSAYQIRMGAIDEYGPVIHEFDPYFNYRATEYLYEHGAKKFFQWFDYMSWYPLGRPVGTTIYPGMQFTAVWIKRYLLPHWSLNDVCCYIPAWFGVVSSSFVGLIAYECALPINSSQSIISWIMDLVRGKPTYNLTVTRPPVFLGLHSPAVECGLFAFAMMAIVPAHLMRSVGGGYDNESVAVTAMTSTFYCWVRSLRVGSSFKSAAFWGVLAGLAYFNMVAAWGGYIFVLNLVGVHAAVLVAAGRFTPNVWVSYSLFYFVGTALAIQVPVVGWAPLKSLEQLGPCLAFLGMQVLFACDTVAAKKNMTIRQSWMLRIKVGLALGAGIIVLALVVAPSGYFGPISSRVRGLFVKHTKTGNPLVDSVAEHQPASSHAYFQYLHHVCSLAPIGFLLVLGHLSESSSFLLVWGSTAYFFSHRMVRLILLTAPIGSALGGLAAGHMFAWCVRQWWDSSPEDSNADEAPQAPAKTKKPTPKSTAPRRSGARKKYTSTGSSSFDGLTSLQAALDSALSTKEGIIVKRTLACVAIIFGYIIGVAFTNYCWRLSQDLSNPTIIVKARTRDGRIIKLDDYREAYWFLRDNTPADSRIMAWWDYGYQITAISNRTTIADGNTWNHEHIALLGMALTASMEDGYDIARHLADYVLVWGGGGGDDLAKSPHLARIANSVYRDHCPKGDITCRSFGFVDRQGTPSPMMEKSFLYRLHGHKIKPGVEADPTKFQEVFRSKYGRVRIFKILGVSQESKEWVARDENRLCDVPGSWFCPGQYPPGLAKVLSRKTDFAQLEDFNRGKADDEYQKQYFEGLSNPNKAAAIARQLEAEEKRKAAAAAKAEGVEIPSSGASVSPKKVDEIYNTWEDTADTTLMWKYISTNNVEELKSWIENDPTVAFIRSRDGRGPMWWAFEQRNEEITKLLMKAGVPHIDKDSKGLTPVDLLKGGSS